MARLSFTRNILPVLAVAGIVAAGVMIGRGLPNRTEEAPAVSPPVTPAAQKASGSVAGSGVVEPSSEPIEIGTAVGGIVEQVFVRPGDPVARGAALFRIDSRAVQAGLDEAQARVASAVQDIAVARTQLKVAQNQLALFAGVQDPRAVSKLEVIDRQGAVDTAAAQVVQAQARADSARAAAQTLKVELARHTVRAPVAARVLQVKTRAGEFAASSPGPGSGSADPLMILGVTDPLYVRVDIDENEIERVELGRPAVVSARGNASQPITVTFVRAEPQVVPKRSLTNSAAERVDVRVLQLIYQLPPASTAMIPGQQVDVFVPAANPGPAK